MRAILDIKTTKKNENLLCFHQFTQNTKKSTGIFLLVIMKVAKETRICS